jgi:regulator of protease activity HflC (stomatin/prohibitin superfamily)
MPNDALSRTSSLRLGRKALLAALVLVVLVVVPSTAVTSVSTAPDQVALAYNAGPFQSKRFASCIGTSTREFDGPFDKHYAYPASQRNYNFSGDRSSDTDPFTIVSRDGIEMTVGGVANFLLNTECATLQKFHELIGNRYRAYMDGDDISGGWLDMLGVYIGKPLDTAMDRAAQKYTWRELYNSPEVKAAWEKEVVEALPVLVDRQTDGEEDFFQNFALTISKPEPPQALKDAVTNEQTQVAQARAAEAKAAADKLAAEAQIAVQRAEAAKIAERIKVLGVEGYLRALAIERGQNPFQPSYGAAVVESPR